MADTGIFCTNAEVVQKAGVNANTTAIAVAWTDVILPQIESQINSDSEYNWSDKYATLNVDVKKVLTLAASNLCAIYIVNYDPNAWSTSTSTMKLNILWNGYFEAIKLLKDTDKNQIFIREA